MSPQIIPHQFLLASSDRQSKMVSSRAKIILLVLFQLVLCSKAQTNTTWCYYCQEDDVVCLDPVNVAVLPSHRCSDLIYVSPRTGTDNSVEPPRNFDALMQKVYQEDVAARSLNTNSNVTYQCIKLSVSWGNNSGIYRSCVPMAADERTCEFLTEEVSASFNVSECNVCVGDNCNGSVGLRLELSVVFGMLFAFVLAQICK